MAMNPNMGMGMPPQNMGAPPSNFDHPYGNQMPPPNMNQPGPPMMNQNGPPPMMNQNAPPLGMRRPSSMSKAGARLMTPSGRPESSGNAGAAGLDFGFDTK